MIDVYEKNDWLKVTFNSKTKRILSPPTDYDLLMQAIFQKFPALELLKEHEFRPQQVDLVWQDQPISDSMQLLQMQRYCRQTN